MNYFIAWDRWSGFEMDWVLVIFDFGRPRTILIFYECFYNTCLIDQSYSFYNYWSWFSFLSSYLHLEGICWKHNLLNVFSCDIFTLTSPLCFMKSLTITFSFLQNNCILTNLYFFCISCNEWYYYSSKIYIMPKYLEHCKPNNVYATIQIKNSHAPS